MSQELNQLTFGNQIKNSMNMFLNDNGYKYSNNMTNTSKVISSRDTSTIPIRNEEPIIRRNQYITVDKETAIQLSQMPIDLFKKKQEELVNQHNRKEYLIQNYQYKINEILTLLNKYEFYDPSIKEFIKSNKKINKENKCITNLVTDNLAFSNQLQAASEQIMKM